MPARAPFRLREWIASSCSRRRAGRRGRLRADRPRRSLQRRARGDRETRRVPPVGAQTFHGIPFRIGAPEGAADRCFIVLEPGAEPIAVPVGRAADRIIVAHRRLRQAQPEDDPAPGTLVAEDRVPPPGRSPERVAVRERFEIGPRQARDGTSTPPSTRPAPASSSSSIAGGARGGTRGLGRPRPCTGGSGTLPVGVGEPRAHSTLEAIELMPGRAGVLVAAITSSDAGEHPFSRGTARTVRIPPSRRGLPSAR